MVHSPILEGSLNSGSWKDVLRELTYDVAWWVIFASKKSLVPLTTRLLGTSHTLSGCPYHLCEMTRRLRETSTRIVILRKLIIPCLERRLIIREAKSYIFTVWPMGMVKIAAVR